MINKILKLISLAFLILNNNYSYFKKVYDNFYKKEINNLSEIINLSLEKKVELRI